MLKENVTVQDLTNSKLTMTEVLHLLYIAKKYDNPPIHIACVEFIKNETTIRNVVEVHETLKSMNEDELEEHYFNFIIKLANTFY